MRVFLKSLVSHTLLIPGAFVAVTAGTLLGLKLILVPLLNWVLS